MYSEHKPGDPLSLIIRACWFAVLIASLGLTMNAHAHETSAPAAAARMAAAANTLLQSLASAQYQEAVFAFDDRERFDWHYVPRERAGLALKAMTADQRRMARAFLESALSTDGYRKATAIMALEAVLREIESSNWLGRDPHKYFFSFFGTPSTSATWGWRVEGHHLSLNITVVKGHLFATAPRFLGANPAEVRSGEFAGRRALAAEEDLARALLQSLDAGQRENAVFRQQAFRDIVTGTDRELLPLAPVGLPAAELNPGQRDRLLQLIDEYIQAMPPEIARPRMDAIRQAGWGQIHFGWAGGLEAGQPHYYRIQGPSFIVEYDNVQNEANHIHTVWRDFEGDFGRDLLREHYARAH